MQEKLNPFTFTLVIKLPESHVPILYVFPYNSQLIITISVYTTNLIVHNISQSHKFSFHAFIFLSTFQGTYWFPNIHTYIYLFILCIHKYILNSSTYIHLLLQVCYNAFRFNLHLYSYINSSFNSHSIPLHLDKIIKLTITHI